MPDTNSPLDPTPETMAADADPQIQVSLVPKHRLDLEPITLSAVAQSFRELRLQALQSDPASFGSSDFTERQEPPSFWKKRLQNPQAKTFALIQGNADSTTSTNDICGLAEKWQGMLVLLGPKTVDPRTYDNESSWKSLIGEEVSGGECAAPDQQSPSQIASAYHIVAVYVSKEMRGKGLARSLVRAAFDALAEECRRMGVKQAICTLGVGKHLTAAQKTYNGMGFQVVGENTLVLDGGQEFLEWVMRRDFSVEL